jgi:hypothetical protein
VIAKYAIFWLKKLTETFRRLKTRFGTLIQYGFWMAILLFGYKKLKHCVRLLFWSGQSFGEEGLKKEGSFKAAEARYNAADQVNVEDLERWLVKARDIQWNYKNIARRKGRLERLK